MSKQLEPFVPPIIGYGAPDRQLVNKINEIIEFLNYIAEEFEWHRDFHADAD